MWHQKNAEWGVRNVRASVVSRPTSHHNSALRTPHSALDRRPVALLELLAAATGAGVVAAHASVRIRGRRTGQRASRCGRSLSIASHQSVSLRLRRHHGCGSARGGPRAPHRGPTYVARATGPRRRSDLDLQLEPALGERAVHVVHQADEHLVTFPLVLDERVLLAPLPVMDGGLELVEIV